MLCISDLHNWKFTARKLACGAGISEVPLSGIKWARKAAFCFLKAAAALSSSSARAQLLSAGSQQLHRAVVMQLYTWQQHCCLPMQHSTCHLFRKLTYWFLTVCFMTSRESKDRCRHTLSMKAVHAQAACLQLFKPQTRVAQQEDQRTSWCYDIQCIDTY